MDLSISITQEDLAHASQAFSSESAHLIARNAASSNGLVKAARNPSAVADNGLMFDIDLNQGERCNQKQSGRCWMFASLNTFRYHTIKKFNLKTFEFSQTYPLFWDKLEKSNWFLENILDTLDEPLDGRLLAFLLADPVADGGQWDMFKALVKKYGVVPKDCMPETVNSSSTREMVGTLTRLLRGDAKRLRESYKAGVALDELREMKKEMMSGVYRLLAICLGEPPQSVDVRLHDKNGKLALSGTFTPQEFFQKAVGIELDDYVSLISAPTADKPYNHVYSVSRLGNVVEAGGVRYLNLEIDELKRAALKQLHDELPVWFGCDVGQNYLRDEGIMDTETVQIDQLLGLQVVSGLNRAERLDYGESLMTHAMVLEGVRFAEPAHEGSDAPEKPVMWKVENSWGCKHGRDGFDTLSDAWFDEYVYQIVVDKRYLTDEQRHTFETEEPTILAPWDPMGSLACTKSECACSTSKSASGSTGNTASSNTSNPQTREGYLSEKSAIDPTWIHELTERFTSDRANRVARNAVTSQNINASARDVSKMRTYHDTYSVSRKRTGKITNQKQSGRCWIFSAMNSIRANVMDTLDVDDFEFSQSYVMFYDKLEKFNAALSMVIETAERDLEDRLVRDLLADGIGDGGYYSYATNLLTKWGAVPKDAMPDTACATESSQMNRQLDRLFRKSALELRRLVASGASAEDVESAKKRAVQACHQILCVCLGEPPLTFDFVTSIGKDHKVDAAKVQEQLGNPKDSTCDKDDCDCECHKDHNTCDKDDCDCDCHNGEECDKDDCDCDCHKDSATCNNDDCDCDCHKDNKKRFIVVDKGVTPQEFLKTYAQFNADDYVQLIYMPSEQFKFNQAYHLKYLDTVAGAKPMVIYNVDIKDIEQAAIASLKAGVALEMACDVMQEFPRNIEDFPGVLATDTMDYNALFGIDLSMNREDMLSVYETTLTHAMTFQGVQLDEEGNPVAWRIENSWGDKSCKDGYLIASAEWIALYGTEIAVQKRFLPEDLLKQLEQSEPIELEPWSPFALGFQPTQSR